MSLKSTTFGSRLASSAERRFTDPVTSTKWSSGGAPESLRKTRHNPELEEHNTSYTTLPDTQHTTRTRAKD